MAFIFVVRIAFFKKQFRALIVINAENEYEDDGYLTIIVLDTPDT